jgi:drug/metabolite transporter (DMT)-like permease
LKAALGICIVVTKGNILDFYISSLSGLVFAVISTFIWALYWIVNTKISIDPVVNLFLNFLFSFPFILITCYFCSSISANMYGVLGAFYVGFFEMGLAFILWLYALKLADNKSAIINLTYLSPVFALFFIQVLTGEKIVFSTIIGLVVIIFGLLAQKKQSTSSKGGVKTKN